MLYIKLWETPLMSLRGKPKTWKFKFKRIMKSKKLKISLAFWIKFLSYYKQITRLGTRNICLTTLNSETTGLSIWNFKCAGQIDFFKQIFECCYMLPDWPKDSKDGKIKVYSLWLGLCIHFSCTSDGIMSKLVKYVVLGRRREDS